MKESSVLFANSISNYAIGIIQNVPGRRDPCMSCLTPAALSCVFHELEVKITNHVDIVWCHSPWLILVLTKEPENMVKYAKQESTKAAWRSLGVRETATDGSGYEESLTEMQQKHEGWTSLVRSASLGIQILILARGAGIFSTKYAKEQCIYLDLIPLLMAKFEAIKFPGGWNLCIFVSFQCDSRQNGRFCFIL